jgi:hypothetical protein
MEKTSTPITQPQPQGEPNDSIPPSGQNENNPQGLQEVCFNDKNITIKYGKYRHFSGEEYEVIGVAHECATMEPLVIYKPLYECLYPQLWARSVHSFVDHVDHKGTPVKRFTKISD